MTAQALIGAFCDYFGITRGELARIDNDRHGLINAEFDAFFAGRPMDDASLREFYARSEWLPYGLLHCAVGEIQSGQTAWVQKHIRNSAARRVLDWGCGLSPAVGPLADEGFNIVLADCDGKHLGFVHHLYPAARIAGLPRAFPTGGDGAFDVMVCQEVFEHTFDPLKTANDCLALVKEDGIAILSWNFSGSEGNHLHLSQHGHYAGDGSFGIALQNLGWEVMMARDNHLRAWRRRRERDGIVGREAGAGSVR